MNDSILLQPLEQVSGENAGGVFRSHLRGMVLHMINEGKALRPSNRQIGNHLMLKQSWPSSQNTFRNNVSPAAPGPTKL